MAKQIVIFRKEVGLTYTKGGGKNRASVMEWVDEVNESLRVPRPELMSLFAPVPGGSAFSKLAPVSESQVRRMKEEALQGEISPAMRELIDRCGWVLPTEELGRMTEVTQKSAESVRLQIKNQFARRGDTHGLTVADPGGMDIACIAI